MGVKAKEYPPHLAADGGDLSMGSCRGSMIVVAGED